MALKRSLRSGFYNILGPMSPAWTTLSGEGSVTLPKYLIGIDRNYYNADADEVEFRAGLVVEAESPYSLPTSIEPYGPDDTQAAKDTARWLADWPDNRPFNLWMIWSTKTVVSDADGNFLAPRWPEDEASDEPPQSERTPLQDAVRRVRRRGYRG